MTNFWCLECDSTFHDESLCPYCGERNFDVADDDEDLPGAVTDPYETSGPNGCAPEISEAVIQTLDAIEDIMLADLAEFDADDSGAQVHIIETEDA